MYSFLPSFVLGFHGCDREVGEKILAASSPHAMRPSRNDYDWLGNGMYFWENNPSRALQYAADLKSQPERTRGKVDTPFVVGAVIDPGHCLNLLDADGLELIKAYYGLLRDASEASGTRLPENRAIEDDGDPLIRKLDCAVIEATHQFNKEQGKPDYDTVRGVFFEGKHLYPNAGFKEKNHIQICVRMPRSIKGFFRVLEGD